MKVAILVFCVGLFIVSCDNSLSPDIAKKSKCIKEIIASPNWNPQDFLPDSLLILDTTKVKSEPGEL